MWKNVFINAEPAEKLYVVQPVKYMVNNAESDAQKAIVYVNESAIHVKEMI